MKLIICKKCDDVARLVHTEWRKCYCGKSGGQYNDDFQSATVGGDCEVIGIRNDWVAAGKKKREDPELNHIIEGEYLGDVQIHRLKSGDGPKIKMTIEENDDGKTNTITFTDKREYTINLKGNKSPKSVEVPRNEDGPSFQAKDNSGIPLKKNEGLERLKNRLIEGVKNR